MDGNFAMVPAPFKQLYVVRVVVNNVPMAIAYALLFGKTTAAYETIFRELVQRSAVLNINAQVRFAMTDFETAAINAASHVFGQECEGSACFFHLTQVNPPNIFHVWKY